MAIQQGSFIQGRLGNLLYSIVKVIQIIFHLPAPGTRWMSKKSINECNTVSMTISLYCAIRKSIYHLLGEHADRGIVNRLHVKMVSINKAGRDIKTLDYIFNPDSASGMDEFKFNLDSKLSPMLPITLSDYRNNGIITVNEDYPLCLPRFPVIDKISKV